MVIMSLMMMHSHTKTLNTLCNEIKFLCYSKPIDKTRFPQVPLQIRQVRRVQGQDVELHRLPVIDNVLHAFEGQADRLLTEIITKNLTVNGNL
jgi:hypothetical protein